MSDPKIIVALDFADADTALGFARRLSPGACRVKVGKELFVSAGPALVRALGELGFEVFLDLKFHDIPTTVERACAAAARLGVWMLNVHALGGSAMLEAARAGVDAAARRPLLIGVTVLTSTSPADLAELGIHRPLGELVGDLAALSVARGLDGVVCSAREAAPLRERLGAAPLLVTPGIRPAGAADDDQHRIVTPSAALAAGASYLVIGRPITRHADPAAALAGIDASLA